VSTYDGLRNAGDVDEFCRNFTDDPDCLQLFVLQDVDTSGGI
jgi:hypothetical protein